jgi:ribose 5-phosphate isomerase A
VEAKPDWCFDGADEVDPNGWLIKGRGGAMFKEKLNISNSSKTYILVDKTKFVSKLCEKFPVPVECVPESYISVKNRLLQMGAADVRLRLAGKSKDGPVITENGNYILDAKFNDVLEDYEVKLKSICGVFETGLFIGYDTELISS